MYDNRHSARLNIWPHFSILLVFSAWVYFVCANFRNSGRKDDATSFSIDRKSNQSQGDIIRTILCIISIFGSSFGGGGDETSSYLGGGGGDETSSFVISILTVGWVLDGVCGLFRDDVCGILLPPLHCLLKYF